MIWRSKTDPAPPVTVTVAQVVDELIRSHGYGADVEARAAHGRVVREMAGTLGLPIDAADWLPSLTTADAARVLAAVVARPDPVAVAQERAAAADEAALRAGRPSPAQAWVQAGGDPARMGQLMSAGQGEAWGPGDTELGPLRAAFAERNRERAEQIANSIFAAPTWPAD